MQDHSSLGSQETVFGFRRAQAVETSIRQPQMAARLSPSDSQLVGSTQR